MTEPGTVRVFVSSPSDVRPERLIAERVVKRLAREFAYCFRLEPVLWEREPLLATHHFQDLIVPPHETDIVVTVLWSRLGVPLPEEKYRGAISHGAVTGTEWEFEDAVAGFRTSGLPDLLLYRKRAKITVELGDRATLDEQQRQTELVEDFMRRWVRGADGKSFAAASWEFADASEFESQLEEHLRALLRKRLTRPEDIETPATQTWYQGSPYRGLESFELEHAPVFFGRMRARNEIRETLARQVERACGFVLVIGASGSGKSSLVKAGVLPDLLLPGMVGQVALCCYAVTRPGSLPDATKGSALAALAQAMFSPTALPELAETPLEYTPDRLRNLLEKVPAEAAQPIRQGLSAAGQKAGLTARGEARLVLIVDQLEELFTAGIAREQRENYVAALDALARSGLVWVIATMRSDFFDRVAGLPALAALCAGEGTYLLTPPDGADIGQIIRRPAREAGLRFETDQRSGRSLDETIREAAAKSPGSLPLLEYLLDQLWHRRSPEGVLTIQAHDALNGLEGAIGERAEEVLKGLPEDVQAALPSVLRALVTIGQGEQAVATARLVPLSAFPEGSAGRRLVEALIQPQARILVADGDGSTARIRVAHEALLTHWPRARQRIAADRRDIRTRVRLEEAEARWREAEPADRDSLLLSRGLPLSEGEGLLARRRAELDPALVAFVDSSARAAREADLRRMRARRLRMAALGALAVVASGFAAVGWYEWQQAAAAKHQAEAANKTVGVVQRLGRQTSDIGTKPQRSLLLSVHAASLGGDLQAGKRLDAIDGLRQQLRVTGGRPLPGHEKSTQAGAFSADGRWLATGSDDGAIRLWDLQDADPASRSVLLGSHRGAVNGLAFSPDRKWLVSGSEDGTLRLWDLTSGGAGAGPVLAQPHGAVRALAISPGGEWLAFGTENGHVCIWKLAGEGATEAPCSNSHDAPVARVMFSAKGRWLATAAFGDLKKQILLWDFALEPRPAPPRILQCSRTLGEPSLNAIGFSRDEARLAVGCGYAAQVWDLSKDKPPEQAVHTGYHNQWVHAVDISPDGRWMASGSIDTNVKLWDLTDSREVLLNGHSATVQTVAFSDDGRWLATAGDDATAYLWDLAGPRTIPGRLLRGHNSSITRVIFSPGAASRHLVTLGLDRDARLWTIPDTVAEPTVLRGHKGKVTAAALSSDGEWIASSGLIDHELMIWSVKNPREPVHRLSLSSYATEIAFSPNRRWLAAAVYGERKLHLFGFPEMSETVLDLPGRTGPGGLGFSPDGRWLVSGTLDRAGTLNLWDVSVDKPSLEAKYRCPQRHPVRALGFDAEGRYATTGEEGGAGAHLWDLRAADPCRSLQSFANDGTAVQTAISSNARWVAAANWGGKGRLYELRPGAGPKLAFEVPFGALVMESSFSRDHRWLAFGAWDALVKVVDLGTPGSFATAELSGHTGRVLSVAFSPDSRFLVTTGEDRTARVWDPEDPRGAPVVLRGHEGPVWLVGFSQDSRLLATRSEDETIRLWHLGLSDLVAIACRTAGRQLTADEIRDFLVEGTVQMPCAAQSGSSPGQ